MARERQGGLDGWSLWVVAAVSLVFGLALLFYPGITRDAVINFAGIALIVVGAIHIVRYFLRKSPYRAHDWDLGAGLTLLGAGITQIVFKNVLIDLVFIAIGVAIVVGGIAKIQAAFNLRRVLYRGWFVSLILAAVSVTLGVLIIARPAVIVNALTQFIGASVIVETVQDVASYLHYGKVIRTYFVD